MFDAVPNDATGYVAVAYVFFFALVLIYIAIIGAKLERLGRELTELNERLEERGPTGAGGMTEATETESEGQAVG